MWGSSFCSSGLPASLALDGLLQDTPAGFGGQGNRVSVEEGWRETWDRGREGHSRWFAKELEMGLGIGFGGKEGE